MRGEKFIQHNERCNILYIRGEKDEPCGTCRLIDNLDVCGHWGSVSLSGGSLPCEHYSTLDDK